MSASAFPPNAKAKSELATAGRCSICGNARQAQFLPFCSKRCADVDLSRWLRGGYAIAGGDSDADDDGDDTAAAHGKAPAHLRPGPQDKDIPDEDV